MDLGHTVDGVGADDAEMGHVDPLGASLLYQGHPPQPVHVVREEGRNVLPVETGEGVSSAGDLGGPKEGATAMSPVHRLPARAVACAPVTVQTPPRGALPQHTSLDRRTPQIPTEGLVVTYAANEAVEAKASCCQTRRPNHHLLRILNLVLLQDEFREQRNANK